MKHSREQDHSAQIKHVGPANILFARPYWFMRMAFTILVGLPWTIFWSIFGLVASRLGRNRSIGRQVTAGIFCPSILKIAGIKVQVTGWENLVPGEPVVVALNHTSYLDIPIAQAALPFSVSYVAMSAMFRIPIFGAYMKSAGFISVRKGGGEQMVNEMVRQLALGESVVIHPEGGRSRTGVIGTFGWGIEEVARLSQARIVPGAISGAFECFGPHHRLIRPGIVRIALGSPLSANIPNIITRLRDQIDELQQLAKRGGPEFRSIRRPLRQALDAWDRHYPSTLGEPALAPKILARTSAPRLVLFDVDGTIVRGSTALMAAMHLWRLGVIPSRILFGLPRLLFKDMLGKLSQGEMWSYILGGLAGRNDGALRALVNEFVRRVVLPKVHIGAPALIQHHLQQGDKVVFISSSPEPVIMALARSLGASDGITAWPLANTSGVLTTTVGNSVERELEQRRANAEGPEHKRLTELLKSVRGTVPYGPGKVVLAQAYAELRGLSLGDAVFYSDSITDMPLLQAVGSPCLISPNPRMARIGRDKMWPILQLTDTYGAQVAGLTAVNPEKER